MRKSARRVSAGQKYGRLTFIARLTSVGHRPVVWKCLCDCGKYKEVRSQDVTSGQTKSCGCLKAETMGTLTHGETTRFGMSTEYVIWANMKQRCTNPKVRNWHRYGGRGIKLCESWFQDFANFLADMGRRPSPKHSIDRIDNDGDYEPSNCRWAIRRDQANNMRSNRLITANGETKTAAAWSRELGGCIHAVARRIDSGWTPERAVTTPLRKLQGYR